MPGWPNSPAAGVICAARSCTSAGMPVAFRFTIASIFISNGFIPFICASWAMLSPLSVCLSWESRVRVEPADAHPVAPDCCLLVCGGHLAAAVVASVKGPEVLESTGLCAPDQLLPPPPFRRLPLRPPERCSWDTINAWHMLTGDEIALLWGRGEQKVGLPEKPEIRCSVEGRPRLDENVFCGEVVALREPAESTDPGPSTAFCCA
jgi:hypothetical protein